MRKMKSKSNLTYEYVEQWSKAYKPSNVHITEFIEDAYRSGLETAEDMAWTKILGLIRTYEPDVSDLADWLLTQKDEDYFID